MKKELSRDRVSGFLHACGQAICNDRDEQVLLVGWGLGNWLLCEGYMWNLSGIPRFDRPRRIEQTLEELTGKVYAKRFWKRYRELFIQESDLQMMVEMGYNSLRVPLAARLFLEEGPQLRFREEGFRLLDTLLDTCEKYGLYVFLDLHAAPGGQTGANTDDSIDDQCRLFIDQAQFERGLSLWEEIALRYQNRWIIGGYDLLNEPIRPVRYAGDTNLDIYIPRLRDFYEQAIARIRRHDQRHMIALEGPLHTADLSIFDHVYDPNMVLHFHSYGCPPDSSALQPYLELSKKLNIPLWLGETGENTMTWFSAMIPLAFQQGISVTLWPWKKMTCVNSPCSVREPDDWALIRTYLKGGPQPDYETAQQIFNQLLHHIQAEHCDLNEQINAHLFRLPGCVIRGTDFDAKPGADESYHHAPTLYPAGCYRADTGMEIITKEQSDAKSFPFDGLWNNALLRLHQQEWVQYSVYDVTSSSSLEIQCLSAKPARLEFRQDDSLLGVFDLSGMPYAQVLSGMHMSNADACVLRLTVLQGDVDIESLSIHPVF